jgi:D-aspartate ligase
VIADPLPALVVSGHTMALAVVRSLGEASIPVSVAHYDPRDMAQASRYVVGDIRVPHPVHEEPSFVAALVDAARRLGRSVLIPTSDESTVAVARNRTVLAENCIVACPDQAVVERFIDKSRTAAIAEACGVAAPRTLVPRSEEDLEALAEQVGFPLLLKPAEGHLFIERFGRKMHRVDTIASLRALYRRSHDAGLTVMLQELIPGDDRSVVNYNAYVTDGVPRVEFTARQLRKAPPQFGSPRVAVSERIPEVIEPGRTILAAMEFEGFACVEFKHDSRDGVYKLMEVNGRPNLSGMLAVRSGVNFPLLQYRHLVEGVRPVAAPVRPGMYWTDVMRDVGYSLINVAVEHYRPVDYVAPYARRHCDAIFDRDDMGPFWARLRYSGRHAVGLAWSALGHGHGSAPAAP